MFLDIKVMTQIQFHVLDPRSKEAAFTQIYVSLMYCTAGILIFDIEMTNK